VFDDVGADGRTGERAFGGASRVADRTEEGAVGIGPVAGGVEVFFEERGGGRMDGELSNPRALAVDCQTRDATTRGIVADPETAEFAAAEGVVEENSQNGSVAFTFQCVRRRGCEQSLGLGIGEGRGLALVGPFSWAFHTVDGVRLDGVLVGEEVEEFREG
jgi:hypothetical protein